MSPILANVRERVAMFEDVVALDSSSVALCVVYRFAACIPQSVYVSAPRSWASYLNGPSAFGLEPGESLTYLHYLQDLQVSDA